MKWRIHAASLGVGLVAGALAGGVCGAVLARSAARREYAARLDKAVAEVKNHYARPVLPRQDGSGVVEIDLDALVPGRKTWANTVAKTLNDARALNDDQEPVLDPLEGIGIRPDGTLADDEADGTMSEGTGSAGDDCLRSLEPVPDDEEWEEPPGPFEISREQFGELANEGFQCISVTYFAEDRVLADDHDQPLREDEANRMVGALSPTAFGGASGDPHIRYVRNRRLEVDFEILLKLESFAGTVLGYGQPNKPPGKSTKSKTAG